MSHYVLGISLGHNSSAGVIINGEIVGAYEEERFTQKKSDSSFPIQSIKALKAQFDLPSNTDICVSHWFLDGNVHNPTKYWEPNTLLAHFPDANVYSLKMGEFTHHDAHARSAQVFAGPDFAPNYHLFIIDGFGTAGEVISIYEHNASYDMRLVSRVFGFQFSLGLFYQYATAFCGMKMNNHEYKQLAYETRITNVPIDIDAVNEYIDNFSKSQMKKIGRAMVSGTMDPMVSLDALIQTQMWVDKTLHEYLVAFDMDATDLLTRRILVSYFSQRYVENMVMGLFNSVRPENLLVAGGFFLNVKVNHLLANATPGKFCVMPLAGDQGCWIGVYQHYFGDLKWPGHLKWGHRTLDYDKLDEQDGIEVVETLYDAHEMIRLELDRVGFVNIVRGAMEYGPRALCNTTTLAIPSEAVGALVNKMNDRTNEMPFALVCTEQQAHELFEDIYRVYKSLEYMICVRKFRKGMHICLEGGAHFYPLSDEYTCRPQITRDPFMVELLVKFGPLINTSWNYHGVPIVLTTEQVIYTHVKERQALPDIDFKTIVIRGV